MSAAAIAKNLFRNFQASRARRSLLAQLREYRGFVPIYIESDQYIVETAMTPNRLLKALELRHEVFIEEWQGRRLADGLDVDAFDFSADHLLITDKDLNAVVGTYRLICSRSAPVFYSSSEFNLDQFLRQPGVKLELGRACVHSSFRSGGAIDLLWKGLARYIETVRADYLFGCSSLKTMRADVVASLLQALREQNQWSDTFEVRPHADYAFPNLVQTAGPALGAAERKALLPPLLRSYLNAGAGVYGWPALDLDFGCTDLLTILNWHELHPRFRARFV